jgi:hypothetical protein
MRSTCIRSIWIVAALWLTVTTPALAALYRVSSITFLDEQNDRRIYAFVAGDGRLRLNVFNGSTWNWIDHGLPPGATQIYQPQAVTYVDSAGHRRIYVFAVTGQGQLWLRFWNGFEWKWVSQGGPPIAATSTSAITYIDPAGNRRIYLFGISQGHLVTNYWNGSAWQWADQGTPPGANLSGSVTDTITYLDEGARRIDVVFQGFFNGTGMLFTNSWNGSSWSWMFHGGTTVGKNSTVTYSEAGSRRIAAFVQRGEFLYARIWNGSSWDWVSLGRPTQAPGEIDSIFYSLDAIAFTDSNFNQRMQVFGSFGGEVSSRIWNGTAWLPWTNHGLPPNTTGLADLSALSYTDSRTGTPRIHLFAPCGATWSHLCMHYFNGASWQWFDQGAP